MTRLRLLIAALIFSGTAAAIAEPASEASIRELLTVTQARELSDGMNTQLDESMSAGIRMALGDRKPTPKQQRAIDNMKDKMLVVMRGELAWERMEPLYIRVYRESLSEEEVAGMLEFYRTPAGQALIRKMPLMMQKIMPEIQGLMSSAMPKMQQAQREFMAEMKAAGE
ncbi:hypothetical protein BJN45_13520 [Azonexus hydrophilus]|uniref:DUF2059 domain-containing protein n=1 Tax=Azonexus hydrophilus TaxID=418702 RepID=A0A1R1I3N0_9RHOO|nr:DUF2059 domain-containing protein [Azonexus hydrophilus]OMG53230.1 hypothetical protein BJN45_13520 [Azonexus hydrophilus]